MARETIPESAIVGEAVMTAKVGDIIPKTGQARRQNVFSVEFGEIAMSGTLYGKLKNQKFKVLLIPQ